MEPKRWLRMTADATILKTFADGIARVTLHQPKRRNAMRYAMWIQLAETMQTLAQDESVRVVIVTGAGEQAFCAGADISEFDEWRNSPEQASVYDAATHAACSALGNQLIGFVDQDEPLARQAKWMAEACLA